MIRAFVRFYFSRTLRNWRALRKVCMARLPKLKLLKSKGASDGPASRIIA